MLSFLALALLATEPALATPDLVFIDLVGSSRVESGNSTGFIAIFENQGSSAAEPFDVRFRAAPTSTPSGLPYEISNPLVCVHQMPSGLAAGVRHEVALSCTFPSGISPSDRNLVGRLDSLLQTSEPEADRHNNWGIWPVTVVAEAPSGNLATLPDVQIPRVQPPATVAPGVPFSIPYIVMNAGRVAASPASGSHATRFRLGETDEYLAADPILCDHIISGPIAPFSASRQTATGCVVGGGASPGPYYATANGDAFGNIAEFNEANNRGAGALEVGAGPDLRLTSFTAPSGAPVGASINLSAVLQNHGNVAVGSVPIEVRLGNSTTFSTSDPLVCTLTVPSVAAATGGGPGQNTINNTCTVPSASIGSRYLVARADPAGVHGAPTASARNRAEAFNVTGAALPDLQITSFPSPGTVTLGKSFTLDLTVANTGAAPSTSTSVSVRVGANAVYNPSASQICTSVVPGIGAGQSATISASGCVLPLGSTVGPRQLTARVNPTGALTESNSANNDAAVQVTVAPAIEAPFLELSQVRVPAAATPSGQIAVGYRIENTGGAPAGAHTSRVWLSEDDALDPDDVAICDDDVAALAAGAARDEQAVGCVIPPDTPLGDAWVFVEADADAEVAGASTTLATAELRIVTPDELPEDTGDGAPVSGGLDTGDRFFGDAVLPGERMGCGCASSSRGASDSWGLWGLVGLLFVARRRMRAEAQAS